ncbi:MAG TPA: hypothetical protein VEA37_10805 [Flavobacterium sp.]|nr:hypothetical protein [Flavobacterium sp.]
MSFIKDLGKGFVKSAVNQVGRDTGRQISNRIYNGYAVSSTGVVVDVSELQPVKEYVIIKIIGAAIFSLLLPFVGGLVTIYRGYYNAFIKSHKSYYRIEKEAVFVSDKRYKTGTRLDGYKNVKVIFKGELDKPKSQSNKIKGILYILTGLFFVAFYIYVFYYVVTE